MGLSGMPRRSIVMSRTAAVQTALAPKAWKKDDSIVQHQSRLGQEGFSETVDVAAYQRPRRNRHRSRGPGCWRRLVHRERLCNISEPRAVSRVASPTGSHDLGDLGVLVR
eukprot:m.398187 g.398187  ORF g.398187 m.398187 type:complete len:110 (-) comp28369_c0_seq2:3150-3479(-)